jgi:hypothetical protein
MSSIVDTLENTIYAHIATRARGCTHDRHGLRVAYPRADREYYDCMWVRTGAATLTSRRLLNVYHQLVHAAIVKFGLQDFMFKCHLQQFRIRPAQLSNYNYLQYMPFAHFRVTECIAEHFIVNTRIDDYRYLIPSKVFAQV